MKAWVIWWRWHDGSGGGVVRVYADVDRAQADYALLKELCDGRDLRIEEVEMIP